MAKIAFEFTICETAEAGKIAAKQVTPKRTIPYDYVTWWRFAPVVETSLEAMAIRLRALALQPRRMVIMGSPRRELDLVRAHRRLWADAEKATLTGPARAWLPLDFDDVAVPKGLGRGEQLVKAALFVRGLLPEEFRNVRMVAVPTASSGRQDDCVARLRLFVALDRPHPLDALKQWARGAAATLDLPLDSSIIQCGQPIYTPRPVFEGTVDPIPRALHATILDGERSRQSTASNRHTRPL